MDADIALIDKELGSRRNELQKGTFYTYIFVAETKADDFEDLVQTARRQRDNVKLNSVQELGSVLMSAGYADGQAGKMVLLPKWKGNSRVSSTADKRA